MTKWDKPGGDVLADFKAGVQILRRELERPPTDNDLVISEGEFKLLCSLDTHLKTYWGLRVSSMFEGIIVDKCGRLL
ncbi:MAG: hypothetical protein ACYS7Y_33225 [Planctomycetota bacterium]|jgi:hypothetical protein